MVDPIFEARTVRHAKHAGVCSWERTTCYIDLSQVQSVFRIGADEIQEIEWMQRGESWCCVYYDGSDSATYVCVDAADLVAAWRRYKQSLFLLTERN